MSYFLYHAKTEVKALIDEVVKESEYEDGLTFTSGLSDDFKLRLIEKLAQRLYGFKHGIL